MADVCEDRRDLDGVRARLRELIAATPFLTWQLLTKRTEHFDRLLPHIGDMSNVWLGTTVENNAYAAKRLPPLLSTQAFVRFISAEPLLEPLDLSSWMPGRGISQVIVGGESGPRARPFKSAWAADVLRQCRLANVRCFIKQMGSNCVDLGRMKQAHGADPSEWPEELRVQEFPRQPVNQ